MHLLQCVWAVSFWVGVSCGVTPANGNARSVQNDGEVGKGEASKLGLTVLPDVSRQGLHVLLVVCPGGIFHDKCGVRLANCVPSFHLIVKVCFAKVKPLVWGWLVL